MSIVTNYNINGIDLSNVFQEYIQFQTLFEFPSSFISVASDSSAIYLAGVTGLGSYFSNNIYLSSDGGLSWNPNLIETNLNCVSINSSGQYIATAANGGSIYVSNNYGSAWAKIAYSGIPWNCIKVSSTGQYMVAGSAGAQIFYSTNYGVNWSTSSSQNGYWFSFAMNNDATIIYATGGPGVYKSTNYGSSWVKISSYNGRSIACNSSATQILLGTYSQGAFLSMDSGTTWTNTNLPTTKNASSVQYYAVSSDSSGQNLVASNIITSNQTIGNIYYSNNFGTNWNLLNGTAGNLNASSISTITNENSIIISLVGSNGIYKYIMPTISEVGYNINNLDFINYFSPYVSNNVKAPTTGYLTSYGLDLSNIFKKNLNYIYYNVTGTYTTTSDQSYNTILTFTSGSGTIQFVNVTSTVNCVVIGGGAGGTSGNDSPGISGGGNGGSGGRGGGGGQTVTSILNYVKGVTYSITVGSGGSKGFWNLGIRYAATAGNPSNIDTIVATGGTINTGNGTGGSAGTSGKNGGNGTNNDGAGGGGGYVGIPVTGSGSGGNGGPNGGGNGGNGGIGNSAGVNGSPGTANTGGGGGGGGGSGYPLMYAAASGGNGGSGVVIVKFNI